jgi:signal transduction histidine kinase
LLGREEASLPPEQRELAEAIFEESKRIALLSDNLLNLARGQMPAIAMQRMKLNLGKIVEDVTGRFMLQAQEKRICLETRIEQASEIPGDPVKLSWVISNLIGNALRYTPEGKSIEVTARSAGPAMAQLEVADSGPGIPPEIRDRIFERFTQYDSDGHTPGSAGLGLAIAKDIVEAHGGRIFVESDVEHGSRFVVQLPTMSSLM